MLHLYCKFVRHVSFSKVTEFLNPIESNNIRMGKDSLVTRT